MGETMYATEKERADWWEAHCKAGIEREKKLTAGLIERDPIIQSLIADIESRKVALENMRLELCDLESVVRNVLDEISYEDDTTDTRELRQRLWNDADTEQRIDAEGYKP